MRYRAQLRPSLFIFTGRVTRQQIVFLFPSSFLLQTRPPRSPSRISRFLFRYVAYLNEPTQLG